jgi:hypothetical protein
VIFSTDLQLEEPLMATAATPEDNASPSKTKATAAADEEGASSSKTKATKKVIKGNLPYTQAPGVFKKTLEGIITAGQPERFTSNFMDTVLGVTGGSARFVPPLLKKMGFLTSDGTPTDLYSSFRTEGSEVCRRIYRLEKCFCGTVSAERVYSQSDRVRRAR